MPRHRIGAAVIAAVQVLVTLGLAMVGAALFVGHH